MPNLAKLSRREMLVQRDGFANGVLQLERRYAALTLAVEMRVCGTAGCGVGLASPD
jgi:hypothetical protein